jgi:hypothetical protein
MTVRRRIAAAGLETLSATGQSNNTLRQLLLPRAAQSGAVADTDNLFSMLAMLMQRLTPEERARLAAMLDGPEAGGGGV